jgi:enoyl-CoA hydratase/carnithine racemase
VVADDDLIDVAHADALSFASGPTQAYAAVKLAVSQGFDLPLAAGLAIESEQFSKVFRSKDARIGVAAFVAKKKPEFTGA